ncbi:acyl carrier protein [Kitasatospora acidiphila]|uniref:Acyl carrier protein n=1 Tax=Kitasatospora acidiphila TaxID=2567942 RepID=A0A540W6U4_9ACTN|nr:acyl carrier protein [Kitasatospora acidiphila]TQF04745.1 acyl carrier protein [Kitasatospora acidiphila]
MTLPTNTELIIRHALAQATLCDADTIPEDGHLEQDLGIDSLALHELVVTLEQRLAVLIPDEEVGRLNTISDVRVLLARLDPATGTDTTQ